MKKKRFLVVMALSLIFFPSLALNHNPLDLYLLSSWDYRHEQGAFLNTINAKAFLKEKITRKRKSTRIILYENIY
jgi:hypothetical protein